MTGEGGDILVLDDPHKIREAESEATRPEAVLWHNRIWSTRGNNPATVCRGVPAPTSPGRGRRHPYEGRIRAPESADGVRSLPRRAALEDRLERPRKKDGELLHPALFSAATVANLKTTLGSYAYAAQFQQRPTPLEGGMFKCTWWRFTDASPADGRKTSTTTAKHSTARRAAGAAQ
jgi:hypothetical protein